MLLGVRNESISVPWISGASRIKPSAEALSRNVTLLASWSLAMLTCKKLFFFLNSESTF